MRVSLDAAGAAVIVALLFAVPGAAFSPLTQPQVTTATPTCTSCAFVADQLQRRLPFETSHWARKKMSASEDPGLAAELATLAQGLAEGLVRDGWTYHVDTNRVLQAPADEALRTAPPPPADLDHEPAAVIIARRERRQQLGLRPRHSPWSTTVFSDFVRHTLKPHTDHYVAPRPASALPNGTAVELPTGVTEAQARAATQPQGDGAHHADLVRALAAFIDTANLDRVRPPTHFLARLVCVAELAVCAEEADVAALEAVDVTWHEDRLAAERRWRSAQPEGLEHRAPQRPPDDAAADKRFTEAFVHRLSAAVARWNAAQGDAASPRPEHEDL